METKKTILVIEDEDFFRELLVLELKNHGYDTIEARDGLQAVELWQKHMPDLVLMDILLPGMDGFEVLKTMREHPSTNPTPVVVLSNLWDKRDIERMQNYNIEEYFIKAHNTTEEVLSRIDQVFAKK